MIVIWIVAVLVKLTGVSDNENAMNSRGLSETDGVNDNGNAIDSRALSATTVEKKKNT